MKIDPARQYIEVVGSLKFTGLEENPDDLTFLLHRDLNIEYFTVNSYPSIRSDSGTSGIRWMPDAVRLSCPGMAVSDRRKAIDVEFSYTGTIKKWPTWSASVIGKDWVEMGLYFPWYPYNKTLRIFTYDLEIEIDSGYKLFGIGEISHPGKKWVLSNTAPSNDIVICASKEIECRQWEMENNQISVYYADLADSLVDRLQSDLSRTIEILNSMFGAKHQNIIVVKSKREKGGGYARLGGVFLGGLDPETYVSQNESYVSYFSHELSHLWWHQASSNSWEDWLNEGFAEYSALMVIREVYGEDSFNQQINHKKAECMGTPPLWEIDRTGSKDGVSAEIVERVLYSKAPVLLNELEDRIGRDHFFLFCRQLLSEQANTTRQLLQLLGRSEGEETSAWFGEMLRSR